MTLHFKVSILISTFTDKNGYRQLFKTVDIIKILQININDAFNGVTTTFIVI